MIISAKTKTFLRLLHKYIGFIFSLFIFILTITGIMLLYPEQFRLDSTYVSNSYLLKKYKMLSIEDVRKLGESNDEIILIDKSLYFKSTFIDSIEQDTKYAFHNKQKNTLIIFLEKKILFYSLQDIDNGIEVLDIKESSLNEEVLKIGKDKNDILTFGTQSGQFTIINNQILKATRKIETSWLQENEPTPKIAKAYLEIHQGKGIPLHRIITEVHNGKIMGSFLSYIFFLSSVSLLFLIFSSFFFGINIKREKK